MVLLSSATVRTAIDLKRAIDGAAERLQPIGFCPTVTDTWREGYDVEIDDGDGEEEPTDRALMKELSEIKEEHNSPFYIDTLEAPFSLSITREKCEFRGEIVPTKSAAYKNLDEAASKTAKEATATLLKKWFDGGAVSGFGDMVAQETKVDPSVRNAREIPAAEFAVAPELLDSVQKHWAAHFFPTLVRVEPYKIHLYGPGGKFEEHRDTPETDLVGTFLVGLGDTTGWDSGMLWVKGLNEWDGTKACPGAWVAFYPDVKHQVTEIVRGYRAVIAVKIFRVPGKVEDPMKSVVHAKIQAVLDKMPMKYGLLLERQYCKGTTQLSGFDAHLLAAAKARTDVETCILSVLTKLDGMKDVSDTEDPYTTYSANVFPLMEPHIDALLKSYADSASDSSSEEDTGSSKKKKKYLKLSLKGTEAAWIEERNVSNVPFYSPDLPSSIVVWRKIAERGAEYVGNESRPSTEDSIYLSYAMVVLPKTHEKRKREDDDE